MFTHTRNDLRLPFLSPLGHFRINLFSQLWLDFTRITREKREESLGLAVDYIDIVQRDCVDDFFSSLEFTVRALNEFGLCVRAGGKEK